MKNIELFSDEEFIAILRILKQQYGISPGSIARAIPMPVEHFLSIQIDGIENLRLRTYIKIVQTLTEARQNPEKFGGHTPNTENLNTITPSPQTEDTYSSSVDIEEGTEGQKREGSLTPSLDNNHIIVEPTTETLDPHYADPRKFFTIAHTTTHKSENHISPSTYIAASQILSSERITHELGIFSGRVHDIATRMASRLKKINANKASKITPKEKFSSIQRDYMDWIRFVEDKLEFALDPYYVLTEEEYKNQLGLLASKSLPMNIEEKTLQTIQKFKYFLKNKRL